MIWEVGGEICPSPASIETPVQCIIKQLLDSVFVISRIGTLSNRRHRVTTATGDVIALVPHVVTWCCVEVENVRTWDFTSRREREHLIFCFDPF